MFRPGLAFGIVLIGASFAQGETPAKAVGGQKQAGNGQATVFRLNVTRVPLDIVVTDKQGNPVKGLRERDFDVKEDKKPQRILTFSYEDGSGPGYTPSPLPPMPLNTFADVPDGPERGPLYVLYYDMVNTAQGDQMSFHKQLLDFVDHAAPGTRIAVFVNTSKAQMVQGFTSDRNLLHASITSKGPGPHLPDVFIYGNYFGTGDVGGALSNLQFIADYLRGIPGRKNLLWLASSFPIPVGPKLINPTGSGGPGGGGDYIDLTDLVRDAVKRTYAALMRSQVAVYPMDLRGLDGGDGIDVVGAGDIVTEYGWEGDIAAATGGKAFHSDNRMNRALDEAVKHGESYYALTYSPSNTNFDGAKRTIEVTLPKKYDYKLNYRTLYYGVLEEDEKPGNRQQQLQARFVVAKTADTLYANIEHGAPMLHDLLFSAHLAAEGQAATATAEQMAQLEDSPVYFKTRRKNRPAKPLEPIKLQKYVIDYGVIDPQLKAAAQRKGVQPVLEFAAAAYDADGRLLNSLLNEGMALGSTTATGKSGALFHAVQELQAPPGAAWIRLAVRDKLNDRTGTLEVKLPLQPEPVVSAAVRN